MTIGTENVRLGAETSARPGASWMRIVGWTLAFQLAWYWRSLPKIFSQGAMPDSDDYQRLLEVRDWMAGQGWYDLFQHRMDPPFGADMHWSRLVDVPIAALIRFFELFADPVTAERLAIVVWPTLLLVALVLVVVGLTRAVCDRFEPLLPVLFTVTCSTVLGQFAPARIDHHSVQILLFTLALLGLAVAGNDRDDNRWGHLLAGAAMAASISVGLDAILLIVAILAWLGIDWVVLRDANGRGLVRTGIGLAATALILYPLNFPPSQWLVAQCDANSIVYLTALCAVGVAFAGLGAASPILTAPSFGHAVSIRLGAGIVAGLTTVGLLYGLFPQCAAGPYAAISPELASRWLVTVGEAKGLVATTAQHPDQWFSGFAYWLVLVCAGAFVTWRHGRERPAIVLLFATLAISFLTAIVQVRAMRIGVVASIPLCVAFVAMARDWLKERTGATAALAGQIIVAGLLLSPPWLVAGKVLVGQEKSAAADAGHVGRIDGLPIPDWKAKGFYIFCNEADQFKLLASLPAGYVMSDENSGPEILAYTGHSVVGGNYHRNGRAIIDMLDFFQTDLEKPRQIAALRGIDYVAWCDPGNLDDRLYDDSPALAAHIVRGTEPAWLERLSPMSERLHVFRVQR